MSHLKICDRNDGLASAVNTVSKSLVSFRHARRFSAVVHRCWNPAAEQRCDLISFRPMASVARLEQAHTTSSIALKDWKLHHHNSKKVILSKNGRCMRSTRRGGARSKLMLSHTKDRRCGKECMKSSPAVLRSDASWSTSGRPSASPQMVGVFRDFRMAVLKRGNCRLWKRHGKVQRRYCARTRHA